MKNEKNTWGYDIFFFIMIIGMIAGIWIWKNIDRTKELRKWFNSLEAENMIVTIKGEDLYTLSLSEKQELIGFLRSIKKENIELLSSTDSRLNGTDFYIKIIIDNQTFNLEHSFIVSGDASIEYKGDDYWLVCDGLKEFLKRIYEKA